MADGDSPSEFKLYHYTPSKAAPVIFILLFLAITTQHTWQMIKHKTWFLTAFIIGGICTAYLFLPFIQHRSC